MTYSLKTILMTITTILTTAAISAQENPDFLNAQNFCNVECENEPCCASSCAQFFLGAELLYLRAYQGGLSNACDWARTVDTIEDGLVISTLTGKTHDPDFKWDLGFSLGAGYQFADSHCGLGAYWTHYNSDSKGRHNRGHQNRWKIDYDTLDVIFGCQCNLTGCIDLTPYAGVKFARIDQKLHRSFSSNVSSSSNSYPDLSTNSVPSLMRSNGKIKEKFQGVGPLIGLEADWKFGRGFSLYGNISVALLYGTFHVNSDFTDAFDTGININHLKSHLQACQTVLDAGFGIRWQTTFCDGKALILQLGLEEHRYFNHNQFGGYGDLSLDGLSFGVGLQF